MVKNFNVDRWNSIARDVVYNGNLAKFTQSSLLNISLLNTGNRLFVEASPYNKIWGIGLDIDTAVVTPEVDWPGTNWLGKTLTELRDNLKIDNREPKQIIL